MFDYMHTFRQAFTGDGLKKYVIPENYRCHHSIWSVNQLAASPQPVEDHPEIDGASIVSNTFLNAYDLFILDRDCTIQRYHGKVREPRFEDAISKIAGKSEIASNSNFDEMRRIRDLYADYMPVSQLIEAEYGAQYLVRFEVGGQLRVYSWEGKSEHMREVTGDVTSGEVLNLGTYEIQKKPRPGVILAIMHINEQTGRTPWNPKTLMVGDRYLTDIVAGNRAGVETCKVFPFKPWSDAFPILWGSRVMDSVFGNTMRFLDASVNGREYLPR